LEAGDRWQTGRVRLLGPMLVAISALWGSLVTAATELAGATVDEPARRDVQIDPTATCDLQTAHAVAGRHPGVRQIILMTTGSWSATSGTVAVVVRDGAGEWRCQTTAQAATFGRQGTRPLAQRMSGDGTTPAGVFPLGVVTAWDGQVLSMFGNDPDPGVLAPYRAVQPQDCWGATRNTARYQHLVNRPNCSSPDEWLPSYGAAYAHAAVIGANLDPISGDQPGETPHAAAIFLHRDSYRAGVAKPTSGCVTLSHADLVTTMRLIDPELAPHFAIGPVDWLRTSG
jgi:L,D-peptidoglycan transpeptidase YkuD (ErfK/YbiS/YcfS/YnhG family)